jgi:cytochrome o ubiquinol oxidase subunit 3
MNDKDRALNPAISSSDEKTFLGFWVYLMTDVVLFATLFATYAVLRMATNDGPSGSEIFSLSFVLVETFLLLTSSFTSGLMIVAARKQDRSQTLWWLMITVLLGVAFLVMEVTEFGNLLREGYGWQRSAFLSAFFTLVGTHGAHIFFGLLWAAVLFVQVGRKKLTNNVLRHLTLFGMFWHFLDVIWIFIFTIIYLMGVAS